VVVSLKGELTFEHSPDFHKAMQEISQGPPTHLIVDLGELTYIDSSGVGTLVEILRRYKARDGRLSLVALQKTVRSVFEITRLDKVFQIFDSVEESRRA
jgi:anti-sigma B factor antagonist